MDATPLFPIGELSRRTGLSVRTIRFYSDEGVVAPTTRTAAGYRLYDLDALLRLELLRTLRELGIDLPAIRRVLDRELTVAEVAAAHADALDLRIRELRLRRNVLRSVARRGSDPEETTHVHRLTHLTRLTRLTAEQRRRLIDDFLTDTFPDPDAGSGPDADAGPDPNAGAGAMLRAAVPDLPDDPSDEQVAAWVELAELVGDEDFRARMRRSSPGPAAGRPASGRPAAVEVEAGEELTAWTHRRVTEAAECGIAPGGERAAAVVDDLVRRFAEAFGRSPGPEFRDWLARRFEEAHDPAVDRYWRLVWIVNGWQEVPGLVPVHSWLVRALRGDREEAAGRGDAAARPVSRCGG
ncbi:MerR family transcriptional regulator [Kitasatospora terrestris]|uniref:MerR family transcriptional regulator n=1 Tax=Kitasatospora terrestris TaxID=258051 RepID=A0ABP9DDQ1_9ACTN